MKSKVAIFTLICMAFGLAFLNGPAFAQEKKFAEIVGDYEFEFDGQVMLISFWEEDGVLYGAPEGETPEALDQVEGKPMNFEVTVGGGQFYELEFKKDESGKVTKCAMAVGGMEIEGVKINK